jgi:hypothetical protein
MTCWRRLRGWQQASGEWLLVAACVAHVGPSQLAHRGGDGRRRRLRALYERPRRHGNAAFTWRHALVYLVAPSYG